jgi:tRNA(fMet)-specific endonuclease VapC
MSLYIFDTDSITHYQLGNALLLRNMMRHLGHTFAISVITVEEQLVGWQRALRQAKDDRRREAIYEQMARAVEFLAGWRVFAYPVSAMNRHAAFMRQRLNVGSNDVKIAAIALEYGATVVTRNLRDFRRIPGIVAEDWVI